MKFAKTAWILMILLACNLALSAAIPAAERQALIDLYNSTNGASWTTKTNWNGAAGTENTWYGVTTNAGNTTVLQLIIQDNNLVGTLPSSLGNLSNLTWLSLRSNKLSGSIPVSLGNLSNLQYLYLYYNQLTGSIPTELGNLSKMIQLHLYSNQLTGSIPTQLGNLSNLQSLYLWSNQLTGGIPTELGNLSNLTYLDLGLNQLTGSIPTSLGNLSKVTTLSLQSNKLTGNIPTELGNLSKVQYLYLYSNQLTGSIPSTLGNLSNLVNLFLGSNQLTGNIPSTLGNLSNLTNLGLQSNQLTGSIPTSLTSLTSLGSATTDIGYNALHTSDAALITYLNSKDSNWAATQTIAPTQVKAVAGSSSVTISWTPITYTGGSGGYRVFQATVAGGLYTYYAQTANKSASTQTVSGLTPGTPYYFVVQTRTDAHANNQNVVDSENSAEVSATPGITTTPRIALSKTSLAFGAVAGGASTSSQPVVVSNSGGGTLAWNAASNQTWLSVSPGSGTGTGVIQVSVNPTGLAAGLTAGTYTGTITVSDSNATNSPQTINVGLTVKAAGTSAVPFGDFATPTDGTTGVTGAIPVTGWVMDDIGVVKVEILRDNFAGETPGQWAIGEAIFVEGARPDIEAAFPTLPMNYKAGWGYMMLTNMLPGQGNGTVKLYAYATDKEGNRVLLGTKTITCSNATAVKPFGTIDSPTQGGEASGSAYLNWGWVLTPQTKTVPKNGSTILVYVDGANVGSLGTAPNFYNQYRSDVSGAFPGLNNTGAPGAGGPVGALYLNTTGYANGVHTIQWVATDDGSAADGIGSRYFSILNTSSPAQAESAPSRPVAKADRVMNLPLTFEPLRFRTGFDMSSEAVHLAPDNYGVYHIGMREVDLLEISLAADRPDAWKEIGKDLSGRDVQPPAALFKGIEDGRYSGYMIVGDELRRLPIGSTLEPKKGTFSWMPGPGFVGTYTFIFVKEDEFGIERRIPVTVTIRPKFGKR